MSGCLFALDCFLTDWFLSVCEEIKQLRTPLLVTEYEVNFVSTAPAIQSSVPKRPWFYKYKNYNRKFVSTVIRVRFNHNYSPHHLARIGVETSHQCSCTSGVIADANHLILECANYTKGRECLWRAVIATGCPLPANLNNILAADYGSIYIELFEFITNNKITL
uniref:Reverse transcriptase zinc-binding domain-containing protein n=1 Tax=Rhodnius prolixus TaxID=13249 RepID=T1HGX5_RHOPR